MEEFSGCPHVVWTDADREDVVVPDMQTYLHTVIGTVELVSKATSQEQQIKQIRRLRVGGLLKAGMDYVKAHILTMILT